MRPLQEEIHRRGDIVAWYLEDSCSDLLEKHEIRLKTFDEVFRFNPIAVFVPGNWVYDFFPGVKVEVFHGYPMKKRIEKLTTILPYVVGSIYIVHKVRVVHPISPIWKKTPLFQDIRNRLVQSRQFFNPKLPAEPHREKPTILYAPTFTKGISSAWEMTSVIEKLAKEKEWNWIITFHPKLDDAILRQQYIKLAEKYTNIDFRSVNKGLETFRESDILLCDSSSLIVEYMMLDKPVVTFRNTHPGPFLLDVQTKDEVGPAIERALTHPNELMQEIQKYTSYHESHRDGKNSARVLEAVDDFITYHQGHIKSKPLNIFRKLRLRWQLKYFKW